MKSNEQHILTKPWTRLSADVERAFFQIERENRWQAAAINGCIAGAAVAIVAWLVSTLQEGDLILFACLGSSAASVVFAPLARNNSLRTIIAAYLIASAVCVSALSASPTRTASAAPAVLYRGLHPHYRDEAIGCDAPGRHWQRARIHYLRP